MAITIQKTVKDFFDFSLNFTRHPISNNLVIRKNSEAVKQSIRNILLTRKGERRFDPNFGSPIYDYLFENYTDIAKVVLKDEIFRVISFYEPRVNILDILVNFEDHELRVDIAFNTNNIVEPITLTVIVNRLR